MERIEHSEKARKWPLLFFSPWVVLLYSGQEDRPTPLSALKNKDQDKRQRRDLSPAKPINLLSQKV